MVNDKKILIVDDSKSARMLMIQCFKMAGFNDNIYLEAANGEEALQILNMNNVFLIVSDYNMPIMDGAVLLKWIKGNAHIEHIPFIMITSSNNPTREKEFRNLGAFTVISKPITPALIAKELEIFINIKK